MGSLNSQDQIGEGLYNDDLINYLFNNFDYKYLPVLFLIHFGSLHYPSAFSPAGQLLTAMILIVRDNSHFRQVQSLNDICSPK